jgi:ferrochelatase
MEATYSIRPNTGVLLVNVGTPDSPSVPDVRRYLSEFLNDPRVIDLPWLWRKLLVNGIIVPFRAPKSAKIYSMLWTDKGSPLMLHGNALRDAVQEQLGPTFKVELAMRYQNPSLGSVLEGLRRLNLDRIIVVPLYPQYASASTGTVNQAVMQIMSRWWVIPELRLISQFYDRPGFIEAFIERGKEYRHEDYDHVLFSFHGLPVRQVDKVYDNGLCEGHDCETEVTHTNHFCYKATCYETARRIAAGLGIAQDRYTVCFQSRLDKNWLEPFSDKVVEEKAKKGCKKLLVFSPAFVADCLETTIEIGHEYLEIFKENGGQHLQLVESLNSHPLWVKAVVDLVRQG